MLEKYLKYLPLGLFVVYFLKSLIFTISYPEAAILAVLGASACFFYAKDSDSKLKELEERINKSHEVLDLKIAESVQKFETRVNEVESIKAQLNALKINSLSRPLGNVRG